MTAGEVAGLIAAIAFLILVLFIGMFLTRLTKTMGEVNKSMKVITTDVDTISKEAEALMTNANELLIDVNGKVATIDPAFQAVADLGTSVSDLNDAARDLSGRVGGAARNTAGIAIVGRLMQQAFRFKRHHQHKKNQ